VASIENTKVCGDMNWLNG